MRLERLRHTCQKELFTAAFITEPSSLFYVTGFKTDPHERVVALYVPGMEEAKAILLLPHMEIEQARSDGWEGEVLGYNDTQDPWQLLASHIHLASESTIAIEKHHMTVERLEAIQETFKPKYVEAIEPHIRQMRLQKSQDEIDIMKEAAHLADVGISLGKGALQEGITEAEVKQIIEQGLAQRGVREMSFTTTVLFGEHSAQPHGVSGERTLRAGDIVLFDLGVVHKGYTSDITRSFFFRKASEQQRAMYDAVLEANEEAIAAISVGKPMLTAEKAARASLYERGFNDYFTHRIGHGLGIDVHEYPSLHAENELPFTAGMTFTIEPGVYIPEIGGIRIEDEVYLTEDGVELLTKSAKNLEII
ncbi:aminopeptidase P family protein [Bacillaceae bacterium SIJ1]|uniref:M24 family metallopeptidase n=1 Tax=Litoribacterium kuwaitense TaxID=1398745 RepID=UPI0013EC281B|nr:Xaa-Pro peptidase family protein [Litoribacterium kuwaitense]NGP45046.1 aminopeptidase P family protein [Litoribacterium kuwaitense]